MENMSYKNRLKELGLESLELRRLKMDLCELYKIRHGLSGLRFEDHFKLSNNTRTRGHSEKLELPACRGRISHDVFFFRVVKHWNSLSDYCVTRPSLHAFKACLLKENLDSKALKDFLPLVKKMNETEKNMDELVSKAQVSVQEAWR